MSVNNVDTQPDFCLLGHTIAWKLYSKRGTPIGLLYSDGTCFSHCYLDNLLDGLDVAGHGLLVEGSHDSLPALPVYDAG